jgi:hypothetical protein
MTGNDLGVLKPSQPGKLACTLFPDIADVRGGMIHPAKMSTILAVCGQTELSIILI